MGKVPWGTHFNEAGVGLVRRLRGERPKLDGPRVNNRIRISPVRVIGNDGSQLGVMPTKKALGLAKDQGLDLVEVSPNTRPPVCKILDYGKWKYDEKKKKNEQKKNATKTELKQIKFRPKTDTHDLEFKIRNARGFLEEGYKVQFEVRFKGRENAHPDTGKALLDKVLGELLDIAKLERAAIYQNRSMTMIVGPK